MTLRYIALLTALFSFAFSDAQFNPFLHQLTGTCTYALQGDIHSGSNTITNKSFLLLRNGGRIEQNAIDDMASAINDKNTAGGYYDFDYTSVHQGRIFPGKDSMFLLMRVGYHQLIEVSFPREAGMVALYGNSLFEGDTVNITSMRFQELKYFQWKLGAMKKNERPDHIFYSGFALGINLGFRNLNVNVRRASLYTAPFGEWISLHSDMSLNRSDYDPSSPFSVQGAGPGLDIFFAWVRPKKLSVAVSLTHLGFIAWTGKGYYWKRDSTILYEGVYIENIFNPGENWENSISADTLDKLFSSYGSPSGYMSVLPANLRIDMRRELSFLPLVIRGSIQYRMETLMKPMAQVCFDWQVFKWLYFSRIHTIGGYGGYTTGFAINAKIGKELWINFGSTDLYRIISDEAKLNLCFTGGVIYRAGLSY